MDVSSFYALFSATCFTLVGLWWKVVESRPQWYKDEKMKTLAGGVYLSFLIPGLMGLGAQVGVNSLVWRIAFAIGAAFGVYYTFTILTKTKTADRPGPFRRNRWIVIVIYALILAGSLGADLWIAAATGLTPIQIEAILLCLLILLAHGIAWEFLTESQPTG